MLLGDFFTYSIISYENDTLCAEIQLNKDHNIFKGHFPGSPIVCVCQVQMVKDIMGQTLKKEIQLQNARDIKFLSMINPETDNPLYLELKVKPTENGIISFSGVLSANGKKCLKIKGEFGEK